jgi:hypothetical protein
MDERGRTKGTGGALPLRSQLEAVEGKGLSKKRPNFALRSSFCQYAKTSITKPVEQAADELRHSVFQELK